VTLPENPLSTLWQWVARAPLPVVLALGIVSSGFMANWISAVESEQNAQKAAVAVAAEQAKTAAETAKKMDEKLDKVLEAVLAIQLQQAAENAVKDRADKPKKKEPK
jgi:hypothetical protein